jgi:hypothetical protein
MTRESRPAPLRQFVSTARCAPCASAVAIACTITS